MVSHLTKNTKNTANDEAQRKYADFWDCQDP